MNFASIFGGGSSDGSFASDNPGLAFGLGLATVAGGIASAALSRPTAQSAQILPAALPAASSGTSVSTMLIIVVVAFLGLFMFMESRHG